jgi:hypothetical protein
MNECSEVVTREDSIMKYWLRWLAILPAATAAYLGIQILIAIGRTVDVGFADSPDYWCQFTNSIAGPYCFVWAGAKTAPGHRHITALVLAVIHGVVSGFLLGLLIVVGSSGSTSLWWDILSYAVGIVTTIVVCIEFLRDEYTSVQHEVLDEKTSQESLSAPVDELQELIDAGFTEDEILSYVANANEVRESAVMLE